MRQIYEEEAKFSILPQLTHLGSSIALFKHIHDLYGTAIHLAGLWELRYIMDANMPYIMQSLVRNYLVMIIHYQWINLISDYFYPNL